MTSDRAQPGGRVGWPQGPWVSAAFREAARFRLRMSLRSTPAERMRDLDAMLEFTASAERLNPGLRAVAERLRAASRQV